MIILRRYLILGLVLLPFLAASLSAHVGSPNVFFEGEAGPNPIRVVIKPPPVVPGLARISVRVKTRGPHEVEVLPIKWDAGRKGAPPPDPARLVEGETNLYSAELWLMTPGAHGVFVKVRTSLGKGESIIPVDAIATSKYAMKPWMRWMLGCLALLLVAILVSIARAAVAEAVLEPGVIPTRRRIWLGRLSAFLGLGLVLLMIKGGDSWWNKVDRHFLNRRLYRPPNTEATASLRNGQLALRLAISDPKWEMQNRSSLIPDHGKLMHLFLIREPALDVMAHLHPSGRDERIFDTALPGLPPGNYRLFADITHESGLSETLISKVEINDHLPQAPWHHAAMKPDPTDSWIMDQPVQQSQPDQPGDRSSRVSPPNRSGHTVEWEIAEQEPFVENRDVSLRFKVRNREGNPASLQLYMGMPGHAIIQREDGQVFTHLHPQGTASMASLMAFAQRELDVNAVRRLDDLICGIDQATATVSFPYAFPKPGRYKVWAQFKVADEILTAAFETTVAPDPGLKRP